MKKNRLVKSKERHKFSISLIFLIIHALKKTFQSFMKWMKTLTISSRIYECMIMKNMEDLNALTGIRRILNFTIMSTTTTKPNHFHYSCCLAIWDPYQEILFILMISTRSVSLTIRNRKTTLAMSLLYKYCSTLKNSNQKSMENLRWKSMLLWPWLTSMFIIHLWSTTSSNLKFCMTKINFYKSEKQRKQDSTMLMMSLSFNLQYSRISQQRRTHIFPLLTFSL